MAKRIFSFLLALLLALSLCACGGTGDGGVQPSRTPPETVSQLPAPEEPSAGQPEAEQSEELPAEEPSTEQPEADQSDELPAEEPSAEQPETVQSEELPQEEPPAVAEDGWYSSKDEVALYIHLYGHLPDNYVTKKEAQELGWTGGSVERYAGKGTAIGGSRFGNYEGLLPDAKGRTFTECDIDTVGRSSRGAKRIIFSNDGLVYYTEDHYESFELLYGEP